MGLPKGESVTLSENAEKRENDPLLISPPLTLDQFTHLSWYCCRILIFSEFILLTAMGNMTYMLYAGSAPRRVFCVGDNYTIDNVCEMNTSYRTLTNCTLQAEYEFRSVNIDFLHFCEETKWVKSSISVEMFGVLIGALIFGYLSDRYGRRKILLFAFMCCSFFSILSSLSHSLYYFTILRTIIGFFNGGLTTIYSVYKIEHIPRQHRLWLAALISFAPNFIIMNAIAYFAHDWSTFQQVLVIISSPAIVLSFFLFESPRWLIGKGRIDEAERILMNIQSIDGCEKNREGLRKLIEEEHEKQKLRAKKVKSYTVRHLFYTRKMGWATLTFCTGMFSASMINYGLMFNLERLSGSIFLNSTYFGVLRWALNSIMGLTDYKFKKCGRKVFHFVAQSIVCICLSLISLTYMLDKTIEWSQLIRICTLLVKAVISQVYLSKGMSAVEFYPTVVRSTAISFKSTWSRVGTILAPQLFIYSPWQSLPYLTLAIMSFIDLMCFQFFLPETKGTSMPDSLPKKEKNVEKGESGREVEN